jgi:hypothetical protein
MSIHFVCPRGHKLSVPDDRAGKQGRCPVCNQRLFIPERRPDGASDPKEDGPEDKGGTNHIGPIIEARNEVPSAASAPPLQPPPVPGQNTVAAVASPPPLPTAPAGAPLPASRAPVHWLAWQKSDSLEGYAISRPDPRQLEIAYWLASLLPFAAAFCAAPALPHMQFAGAPGWAQVMLCAAVLHTGYAAWLALLPDVSTIRAGVYLFAASAALYLTAMIAVGFVRNSQLSALGLAGMRWPAVAWCGLAFAVISLTAGAFGWIARRWET